MSSIVLSELKSQGIEVLNLPQDTLVSCDNYNPFPEPLNVTDDCPGQPAIAIIESSTRGNEVSNCTFYNYVVTRNYTISNDCMDTLQFVQTITVVDTFIEDFEVPADVSINCSEISNLNVTGELEILTDQCGGPIFVNYIDEFPDTICGDAVQRRWIVSDICGNSREKVQTLFVEDDTPPIFTNSPQDLSIFCDLDDNPYPYFNEWVQNLGNAMFADQCNGLISGFAAVPGSYDINDPGTFPGIHPGSLDPISCNAETKAIQSETVDFVIYDICGNAIAQSASFFFIDRTSPAIQNCAEDISVTLSQSTCDTLLSFQIPTGFDACITEDITVNIEQELGLSSSVPNSTEIPVEDLMFKLSGYGPEIVFEDENFISVELNNVDADHEDEMFRIFDEDGNFITETPKVDAQCSSTSFNLGPFSKMEMEGWAEDGIIHFNFVNNINETDPSNSINDVCTDASIRLSQTYIIERNPLETKIFFQVNDEEQIEVNGLAVATAFPAGQHTVQFWARDCVGNETFCQKNISVFDQDTSDLTCPTVLLFEARADTCAYPALISEFLTIADECDEDNEISFEINGQMDFSISGLYSELKDMEITVPLGISTVNIEISDFSGNSRNCSYSIVVDDVQDPTAVCSVTNVPVLAIELDRLALDPYEIGAASFDNCNINNIVISNNNYNCSDLNTTVARNLIVVDQNGNSSSCIANMFFEDAEVPVSFSLGVCPDDSLKFFIDIDKREEYEYLWDGPNGFFSVEEEPFILNAQPIHQGEYFLTVTNTSTGCESYANLLVDIDDLQTPVFRADSIGCEAIPHRLETNLSEPNIKYRWYEVENNINTVLATTDEPFFEFLFEPGFHEVYVRLTDGNCISNQSESIIIDIREQPTGAVICDGIVEGCIGQPLDLCVLDPKDTWIFRWTGPNGFSSDVSSPMVTDSFTNDFSGVYKLVIEDNKCITDTLTTAVTTNITPPVSTIIGNTRYCEGDTLVLASEEINPNYIYVWNTPSGIIRNDEPILRIPAVESNFSGIWTLSIERGPCISEASEEVLVFIEPELSFEIENLPNQCDGTEVQLSPTILPESMYTWTGPNGFSTNAVRPIIEAKPGLYKVEAVTFNGCIYEDQIIITTTERPVINSISSNDNGPCVNNLSTIILEADITNDQGLSYNWQGPARNSDSENFTLSNFTNEDIGIYTLEVSNGACTSNLQAFNLDLIIKPVKPIISASEIVCAEDSLIITSNNYAGQARYFWNTPNGIVETNTNRLAIPNASKSNQGQYSLAVVKGSCTSDVSENISIEVNDDNFIPSVTKVGEDCVLEDLKLFTDLSGQYPLEWELPDGTIIFTDTLRINNASLQDTGLYRVRSISNLCPSDWSAFESIRFEDPRKDLAIQNDYIFTCNNADADLEFCVEDFSGIEGKIYSWNLGDELIGETSNACFPLSDLSILEEGVNQIQLRIKLDGCEIPLDQPLFVEVEDVLDIDLEAGPPQIFCVGQSLNLNAEEPESGSLSAFWSSGADVSFEDIESPFSSFVVNQDLAQAELIWNIEHISCGIVYRDTVFLTQKASPLAVNDTLVFEDSELNFEPLLNDGLIEGEEYRITDFTSPRWGDLSSSGTVLRYFSDPQFAGGRLGFEYEVCDVECPDLCDNANVIFFYKLSSCKGNNVLTPNNDGVNDLFVIPCIENQFLPDNELIILNEVGNVVFRESPYQNNWDGSFNGEPLPEGTYYYFFRRDNEGDIIQDFITIEK